VTKDLAYNVIVCYTLTAVFITMSGTESGALPAQPDEAQISSLVSSVVLKAKESNSLRYVLHKAHYCR